MHLFETGLARVRRHGLSAALGFPALTPVWSRRLFFLDFLVFPAAILSCATIAAINLSDVSYWGLALLCLAGVATWTLVEYLMHRFVFHHFPVFTAMHLDHHRQPHELIGTPTLITLTTFGLLVFYPAYALSGLEQASAFSTGLMGGYLAYVSIHFIVHNKGSGGLPWMKQLIRLHAVHHHDISHNFGVTTGFWDRVFGTLAKR